MEEAALPSDNMLEIVLEDSIDLELMDKLLSEDVWVGTGEVSDLLQVASTSTPPFDSSCPFSPLPSPSVGGLAYDGDAQDRDLSQVEKKSKNRTGIQFNQCDKDLEHGNLSVDPRPYPISTSSVKERLVRILNYIKESYRDCDVLIQMWEPVNDGDRQVLTTCGQPFSISPNCQRLMDYRNISLAYQFSAEENSKLALGLPGRVFVAKVPEWSPDVRYFTTHEYARVNHAQRYGVRGSFGIPIFQRGSHACLGVMEILLTAEKINYFSDLEQICYALQAVSLDSTEVLKVPRVKLKNDSYIAALPEISSVVRAGCQEHGLPLAQIWIPCVQQGKKGCRHSDENYTNCVSTLDASCYVHDPSLSGFHEACSEHHLLRGQGIVGKAFLTNQPCFSSDVSAFSKTEYPLSHHARIFGLRAAVAIRLRSFYTGETDYVLEFFLPKKCLKIDEQKMILSSLSVTVQQACQSLRVVTAKELEDESVLHAPLQLDSDWMLSKDIVIENESKEESKMGIAPKGNVPGSEVAYFTDTVEAQVKDTIASGYASLEFDKQGQQGFTMKKGVGSMFEATLSLGDKTPCFEESAKLVNEAGASLSSWHCFSKRGKIRERKHSNVEKTFSLELLQQYFAGSLKDAAKNLGVCPTTLKRICRQHGIGRWPSRKIKKVGHSLRKLQSVIDSVQGVDGIFQLSSLYANFPNSSTLDGNDQNVSEKARIYTAKDGNLECSDAKNHFFTTHTSSHSLSSSSSQASGSSHSSEAQELVPAVGIQTSKEVSFERYCNDKPQRGASEELHVSFEKPPTTLVRHQSLNALGEISSPGGLSSQCQNRQIGGQLRVKVMYGEEKVRFSLQPTWGFQELKQEIAKRFHIGNFNSVILKYLDDDSEWVLLTCDADLRECIDIYRMSSVHTIKILVHRAVDHQENSTLKN